LSIATSLTLLNNTKTAIKAAIVAKGVAVADTDAFATYPSKIGNIVSGGSSADYVRPLDWLTLPAMRQGDQKIAMLVAVYSTGMNTFSFEVVGNFTVDWGDGTTPVDYSAYATASHTYTYSSLPDSSLSSLGYKQAIITITPQVANNLTYLDIGAYTSTPNNGGRPAAFLDIKMAGSYFTSYGNIRIASCLTLEQFEFVGTNTMTGLSSFFTGCTGLKNIVQFYSNSCTNFSTMFSGCASLKSIPLLNTSNGTNFSSMFNGCTALKTVPLLDTAKGTSFGSMFYNCYSLESIPLLDTSNGTNFGSMFYNCYNLKSIPTLATSKATNMDNMFYNCNELTVIPALSMALVTSANSFIYYAPKVRRIQCIGITSFTLSFQYNPLGVAELVELFTNLGTTTNYSSLNSISMCYGYSSLTTDQKAIATNKGWSMT